MLLICVMPNEKHEMFQNLGLTSEANGVIDAWQDPQSHLELVLRVPLRASIGLFYKFDFNLSVLKPVLNVVVL